MASRETPLTPSRWRVRLGRTLAALDAWVILVSLVVAYQVRLVLGQAGLAPIFALELAVGVAVLPMWLMVLWLAGCYRPEYQSQSAESFRRFFAGTTIAVLVIGFVSFALKLDLSRMFVTILWVLVVVFGYGGRAYMRRRLAAARREGRFTQRVVIAGAAAESEAVVRAMEEAPWTGYQVVGVVDDHLRVGERYADVPVIGRVEQVPQLVQQFQAGLVVVSPAATGPGALQGILEGLEDTPVDVAVAPSLVDVLTRRIAIESVGDIPLVHVDRVRLQGSQAFVKRVVDIVGSLLLGAALLPAALLVVLAIRADSPGPAIFRQVRVGRDGRQFTLLKFRTMVVGAEGRRADLESLNEADGLLFKMRDDPRVTRVGRVLRRWSFDEVPQFWNVIRGDMSLVGPRPPLPEEYAAYTSWQGRRLRIRPGLTGVWQTSGRSDVGFEEAVRLDLFYIENWSVGYDLYLLGRTVLVVLSRKGAY